VSDVRVLDLTSLLPGPYATLLLADLGADVIKIEKPGQGDPVRGIPPFVQGKSARFSALNRNKKSLALDLKTPKGREIFLQLAKSADVVMEGFRPGVVERLGIEYERVKRANPNIIYCSLTGYGQKSPYRDHVGHDVNYIARAGLLSLTGDTPIIPAVPVADLCGALFAAFSVLAALYAAEKGHGGVYLDVSLTDAVLSWLGIHLAEHLVTKKPLRSQELVLTGGFPCYHIYKTRDGKHLALGALEEKFWVKLCGALGVPEFIPHQFSESHREEIFRALRAIFASKPQAQWLKELDPKEIPIAPVLNLAEVTRDPQVRERQLIHEDEMGLAFPVPIRGSREKKDHPAPDLGEHSRQILSELGYSATDIELLTRERVI